MKTFAIIGLGNRGGVYADELYKNDRAKIVAVCDTNPAQLKKAVETYSVKKENTFTDEDGFSERYVVDCGYSEVNLGDKAPNGVQYRPHIVFFGEAVPKMERAIDIVSVADIVIIVGTSLQVYPAAGLYRYARPEAPIYIIDPADVPLFDSRIKHIRKVATEGMKEIVAMLK